MFLLYFFLLKDLSLRVHKDIPAWLQTSQLSKRQLNILQRCVCVRVRPVLFLLHFLVYISPQISLFTCGTVTKEPLSSSAETQSTCTDGP